MLWVYNVYILLAVIQFPIFVALVCNKHDFQYWALNERKDLMVMMDAAPATNQTTAPAKMDGTLASVFVVSRVPLNWEAAGMAISACVFAVLYMFLMGTEEGEDDPSALKDEDSLHHRNRCANAGFSLGDGAYDDSEGCFAGCAREMRYVCDAGACTDELARICFWTFVWLQGMIQTAGNVFGNAQPQPKAVLQEAMWLLNTLRVASLFALSRTSAPDRFGLTQLAAWVGYVWWLGLCADGALRLGINAGKAWLPFQGVLDAVLLLGHRYDRSPSALTVLNCRLVFVSCAGMITQYAVVMTNENNAP